MIEPILLAGLVAAAPPPGQEPPKPALVVLMGGQSNMAGFGTSAATLPLPYDVAQPDVRIWDFLTADWEPLAPGFGNEFGPELSFGRELADRFPDRTVHLVKHAVNGTALHDDWDPAGGFQFVTFESIVGSALGALAADGQEIEIGGMLWMQGESDAAEGQGGTYEANLREFVDAVRTLTGDAQLPFVLGRITTFFGDPVNNAAVRAAQWEVVSTTPWVEGFDTDDLVLANFGHYDSASQIELGLRFANGLLASLVWSDLGGASAGVGGEPALTGAGTAEPGSPLSLELSDAAPDAASLLVWSVAPYALPILGAVLHPDPSPTAGGVVPGATDADGSATWTASWPASAPSDLELYFQAWTGDPTTAFGVSASNGLLATRP